MSINLTTSTAVSYETPSRTRRRRWPYVIAGTVVVILTIGPFLHLGGKRVVGFEYGVTVNNATSICPDQVTKQAGNMIYLADGRSFTLDHTDAESLAGDLARAENMVFVDTKEGIVYGRYRCGYCGFGPGSSQLITIPLIRREMPTHGRKIIAGVSRSTWHDDPKERVSSYSD